MVFGGSVMTQDKKMEWQKGDIQVVKKPLQYSIDQAKKDQETKGKK